MIASSVAQARLWAARRKALELALGEVDGATWERVLVPELVQDRGGRWHRHGCTRGGRVREGGSPECELDLWVRHARVVSCCWTPWLATSLDARASEKSAEAALLELVGSHGMPGSQPRISLQAQVEDLALGWYPVLLALHRLDPGGEAGERGCAIEEAGYELVRAWIAQLSELVGVRVMRELFGPGVRRGFEMRHDGGRVSERTRNELLGELLTPSRVRDGQWVLWERGVVMGSVASVRLATTSLGRSEGWHVVAGAREIEWVALDAGGRALTRDFRALTEQEQRLFFELLSAGQEPDAAWSVARSAVGERAVGGRGVAG